MVGTAHSNNGINVQTITFSGAAGNPVPTYPNRFASIPAGVALPRPTIFAFDPDYQNARTQQASTGLEWEWMPNTSIAVNYLFVKGDDLPRSTDINIGAGEPGDVHRGRKRRERCRTTSSRPVPSRTSRASSRSRAPRNRATTGSPSN